MSSRIKKFERRITRSKKKFERRIARSKAKIKKLVYRVGIVSSSDIVLIDPKQKKRLYPCNLGILFCGGFLRRFYPKIVAQIELLFDGFFYNIVDLGHHGFSKKMLTKGIKKENFKWKKEDLSTELQLHPTNKFYQVLIDKRTENHLDMIMALTNLPIYSSSDNTIMFLYGEANLDHSCCVVSSLILKEQFYKRRRNRKLYEQRIEKEAIHEIGHLILGPEHCHNELCVMNFCQNIENIDKKYLGLCYECTEKLEKLKYAYNI